VFQHLCTFQPYIYVRIERPAAVGAIVTSPGLFRGENPKQDSYLMINYRCSIFKATLALNVIVSLPS